MATKTKFIELEPDLLTKVFAAWNRYCNSRNLMPDAPCMPFGKLLPNGVILIVLSNRDRDLASYKYNGSRLVRIRP